MMRDTSTQTFALSCVIKILSAPLNTAEHERVSKAIGRKFLECIKTFIRDNTEEEFEMEFQLLRAVGEICLVSKKHQRLLIDAGVYKVIMPLLLLPMEDGLQERRGKLVNECLGALYYVLIGCKKNKTAFEESVGYDKFTEVLKEVTPKVADQCAVTNKLFDMIVETRTTWGTKSTSDITPTIRNPQILFVLFELSRVLKIETVVHALTKVIELLGSMPNRNICCKNGVLTYLLNKIDCYSSNSRNRGSRSRSRSRSNSLSGMSKGTTTATFAGDEDEYSKTISFSTRIDGLIIEIIHILGSHTLSASELKHIIRILSFSGPSKTRLPDFPYLIYALHKMPSSVNTPETYFGFDGISSVKTTTTTN